MLRACGQRPGVGVDGEGNAELSPVPTNWTGTDAHGLRRQFHALGVEDPAFELLNTADQARGDARRDRIAVAQGSIPPVVFVLMLILIALALAGYAFVIPRVRNGPQIVVLWIVAVALVVAVLIIRDLDSPFGGLLKVDATAMAETARQITDDFVGEYGAARLPCDTAGNPR